METPTDQLKWNVNNRKKRKFESEMRWSKGKEFGIQILLPYCLNFNLKLSTAIYMDKKCAYKFCSFCRRLNHFCLWAMSCWNFLQFDRCLQLFFFCNYSLVFWIASLPACREWVWVSEFVSVWVTDVCDCACAHVRICAARASAHACGSVCVISWRLLWQTIMDDSSLQCCRSKECFSLSCMSFWSLFRWSWWLKSEVPAILGSYK